MRCVRLTSTSPSSWSLRRTRGWTCCLWFTSTSLLTSRVTWRPRWQEETGLKQFPSVPWGRSSSSSSSAPADNDTSPAVWEWLLHFPQEAQQEQQGFHGSLKYSGLKDNLRKIFYFHPQVKNIYLCNLGVCFLQREVVL